MPIAMSSLWSAAATPEGIFARGFSTARKKKPRVDEAKKAEVKIADPLTKHFQVKDNGDYMQPLNAMRQHVVDLLNLSDSEFTLDHFGGA